MFELPYHVSVQVAQAMTQMINGSFFPRNPGRAGGDHYTNNNPSAFAALLMFRAGLADLIDLKPRDGVEL